MALQSAALEKGKSLVFEILSQIDPNVLGPRLGKLVIPERRPLETPNFFAITSRGVIPHISPDIIAAHTQIGGVHMALEDFIERAMTGKPPIMHTPGTSPLHTFTSLPKSLISLFAPRRTPAVAPPNGNSTTAISIFTSTGFQVLPNKSYISYIETLRPDIAIGLADIAYGSTPGIKRMLKMGDRTQDWLTKLLNEKIYSQAVFAPVLQIDYLEQAEYLNYVADELADGVSGLAFYDSNLLPDIPATTWLSNLPRLSLDEPSSPRQILRQISLGMDIFTIPFIGFATDAGIALSFRFPKPGPSDEAPSTEKGTGLLPLGIDMWPATHATSVIPLSETCTCYTCTSHHRAYVQHLLSAKEMTGWVLLQIHNHHILSEFFSSIRDSIKRGTFDADCDEFAKVYEPELPEKSGQGPRVRGYHFKSEGPGEGKKNKPAWGNLAPGSEVEGKGPKPNEESEVLEEKGLAEKAEKLEI